MPSAPTSSTKRILMVEDEVVLLATISEMLTRKGFSVSTATSSREALLRVVQEHAFDVHVVDVSLPDEDGASLLLELERRGFGRPTIVVSGLAEDEIAERLRGLPRVVVLPKPYSVKQLVATATALLEAYS